MGKNHYKLVFVLLDKSVSTITVREFCKQYIHQRGVWHCAAEVSQIPIYLSNLVITSLQCQKQISSSHTIEFVDKTF